MLQSKNLAASIQELKHLYSILSFVSGSFRVQSKIKLQNMSSEARTKGGFAFHDIYCQMSESNKHFDDYKSCILPIKLN